jgi:uncharacterized protein (TIGR03437 family)
MCRLFKLIMLGQLRLTPLLVGLILPHWALAQTTKPVISAIVNVASYSAGPVAPGEMVVLFGSALGPSPLVNLQLDSSGKIANNLSGVQVLFEGIPAPLVYVSEAQIAAMVPYAIGGKGITQVQATYRGVASDPFSKMVAATAPAIFSADSSGKGLGAINNADGSLNSSGNPVAPGSYVTIYITGYGQTEPPGSDGEIANGIANVKAPVSVKIAGRTAQVLYAGSAPGFVSGFAQVNVQIPADLQYGGSLPLVVQAGDQASQPEITVAVSGPPAPVPYVPLSMSTTVIPPNQIRVAWSGIGSLASQFHIERQTGSGPFTEIAVIPAFTFTFTDSGVVAGTTYQYRVRAENDYGFSPYSTMASASTPTSLVAPPSNLQAVALSQTQISLSWSTANTNATSFQIERKTGIAGVYSLLATVPNVATAYPDTGVAANTTYVYRIRSQGASGFSGYSNESIVSTPAVSSPLAPNLTAVSLSATQIRLSWTSTATGIVRYRLERRTAATQYAEISQPGPSAATYDDLGLSTATAYTYRLRVETGAGLSPYSNEVTATTIQALPAAPTNLTAISNSQTQVTLTWNNNAPDATAIRVEFQAAGSASFTDIGPAPTLSSSLISNLQPNTAYVFRVRAQNAAGYSAYSNVTSVTTLSVPKTVFLLHGLNQAPDDMKSLASNLQSSNGLTRGRFSVDNSFDFSDCSGWTLASCSANCTIGNGAKRLANYIVKANPPGDIVLIGFSMGGLIARDMIANNRLILNGRKIHLVTIGTPNLGYPYLPTDSLLFCDALVSSMYGDWRAIPNSVRFSGYLLSLTNQWSSQNFPGSGGTWLAASGRAYSDPKRGSSGCRDQNPYSDGVVCDDSAQYNVSTSSGTQPSDRWSDPDRAYVHSQSGLTRFILGDNTDPTRFLRLWDPSQYGSLFIKLTAVLNAL